MLSKPWFFAIIGGGIFGKEGNGMQARSFLLTLGLGMAVGGAVALMLPQQSKVRKTAQKAVDSLEQSVSQMMG